MEAEAERKDDFTVAAIAPLSSSPRVEREGGERHAGDASRRVGVALFKGIPSASFEHRMERFWTRCRSVRFLVFLRPLPDPWVGGDGTYDASSVHASRRGPPRFIFFFAPSEWKEDDVQKGTEGTHDGASWRE